MFDKLSNARDRSVKAVQLISQLVYRYPSREGSRVRPHFFPKGLNYKNK
jgi:hypothetical protein